MQKIKDGLFSHELFTRAFQRVVLRKDHNDASPKRKLEILLAECEKIHRDDTNQIVASESEGGEETYSPVDRG